MNEEPAQSPGPIGEAAPAPSGPSFPEGTLAPEISRRVTAILDAVEREAEQLRADAHEEARRYLEHACRQADGLVDDRRRRIAELSDEIVAKAEAVVGKLDDAAPVREGFESLVRGLGDAAERLSSEARRARSEFDPPAFHAGVAAAYPPDPAAGYQQPGYEAEGAGDLGAPPPEPHQATHEGGAPMPLMEPQPAPAPIGEPGAPAWSPVPPAAPPRPPAAAPPPAAEVVLTPGQPVQPDQPQQAGWQGSDDMRLVAMRMAAAGQTRNQVGDHLHHSMGVTDPEPILAEVFGAGSAGSARVPWAAFPR